MHLDKQGYTTSCAQTHAIELVLGRVPSIFTPSLCLMHAGKPTGVAVSHCITWFQTQLILTTCQIRYHSLCGIIVTLDNSEP